MTYGRHPDCQTDTPTVWDYPSAQVDALEAAGIPDWLADMLVNLKDRGYSNDALAQFAHDIDRHIVPIIEGYEG